MRNHFITKYLWSPPQSFPNVTKRGKLDLPCVYEAEVLLQGPVVHAGHLDDCHRMTVNRG